MKNTNEIRRINIDISQELWHKVGIESAKLGITKKEFTERALLDKLKKESEKVK